MGKTIVRGVGLILLLALLGSLQAAQYRPGPEPVTYTLRFPDPATQFAEIEASFPTGGSQELDLMMPVWSPGYYRVQDYAARVRELSAQTPGGEDLLVERTLPNRWRVRTEGAERVLVTYVLHCPDSFVTTNWVSPELLVLNGGATYITLLDGGNRPHYVQLELAPTWRAAATGLPVAPDNGTHHFRAPDFDTLVDSPIVAGDLDVTSFHVAGVEHLLVDVGEREDWDAARAARDLQRIIAETLPFWGGELPYDRYVFLNVFRRGGGGLEHANSTLLTTSSRAMATPASYRAWLNFATHEYFHAFNVKRLRPVELGPFDYEAPPSVSSLWFSEGVTSYYSAVLLARAGIGSADDLLAHMSSRIARLQNSPGRLLQTLEEASLHVWDTGSSGIGGGETTVSYYLKGEVAAFLLDARIRNTTDGKHSLQDLMIRSYQRYGGERGFAPEELQATAEEIAGTSLADWFHRTLASTSELDYDDALDCYGLRFADDGSWTLEARDDASDLQRTNLAALLGSATGGTAVDGGGRPLHRGREGGNRDAAGAVGDLSLK
jgi:predicted metalloprotease with PDZ domain